MFGFKSKHQIENEKLKSEIDRLTVELENATRARDRACRSSYRRGVALVKIKDLETPHAAHAAKKMAQIAKEGF